MTTTGLMISFVIVFAAGVLFGFVSRGAMRNSD